MKQESPLLWYKKKEPITQIEILKSIALNGFQSKTSLSKKLDSKITTIDTIIGKMNDIDHGLVQNHRKEQVTKGKASHIMFSLTEKGIRVLIENRYEKNKVNEEKGISEKSYLSPKEFINFLSRYKTDYTKQKPTKEFVQWTPPKLTEKTIIDLYLKTNPEYKIALGKELQQYNSRLGKLVNKLKDLYEKTEVAEDDFAHVFYESFVYAHSKNFRPTSGDSSEKLKNKKTE